MGEESAGLRQQYSKQAIDLAMQGRWREAVTANRNLIEGFPGDVSAYNRLGRAYTELGEFSHAREAYSRAIELDPYNTIAQKNLNRLSNLDEVDGTPNDGPYVEPYHFIEETGKAGVVSLSRLGPPQVLAKMVAGDKVYLKIDGAGLAVENSRGEYLGQVRSKDGQRLNRLLEGGNRYIAAIVSAAADRVTVIIRETYQDPSQANRPSFPLKGFKSPRPYVSERVKHELDSEEADEESYYGIIAMGGIELPPESAPELDDKDNEE
ncbi:MAG: tetratricopeptide repeat protein [Dehalococcoidales bacterium]|nr:tetratricopeptide repeat protein [Dehalococcoidales bacterium]